MEKTAKISYGLIDRYLRGDLDKKQMHELEREALEDPFLAEALEGYASAKKSQNAQLSILQKQLEERIAVKQEEKNRFHFTWQRISIAAAAGLLFIAASILYWMKGNQAFRPSVKEVEVNLPSKDGLGKEYRSVRSLSSQVSPEPQEGWARYNEYLAKSQRELEKTRGDSPITIRFSVDELGVPSKFVILEGSSSVNNARIIQLIKEGPRFKKDMAGEVELVMGGK